MRRAPFLSDQTGSAGAEMALMLPLLLVLLFGGLEAGHFFWTEHKVIEAVRDGARYASRLPLGTACSSGAMADIALLTRTGQLSSGSATPVVPGWTSNSQVSISCGTYLSSGIYQTSVTQGETVTVAATGLSYPSLLGTLGVLDSSLNLNASVSMAVIGI